MKSGVYNVRINVPTNGTTYTVTNLPTGATYYFAVVARNVAGLDSDPSNEVNQTLERPAPVPGVRTVHLDTFLEAAPYPDGPWTNYVKLPRTSLMASMDRRFFRVRVEAQPGPTLLP
ncbi:MAG: fibronectin type III domain-containing protein [Verrucomicrobia bacterium]|nr:fibronectin type III domain-containing protein [Verrucomicrobiota bacterium]